MVMGFPLIPAFVIRLVSYLIVTEMSRVSRISCEDGARDMVCGEVELSLKQDKQVHYRVYAQLPKGVRDGKRDTDRRNTGPVASCPPGDGEKPDAPPLRASGASGGNLLR